MFTVSLICVNLGQLFLHYGPLEYVKAVDRYRKYLRQVGRQVGRYVFQLQSVGAQRVRNTRKPALRMDTGLGKTLPTTN